MVEKYLRSKKGKWAPSTLKSESARLRSLETIVGDLEDPAEIIENIKEYYKGYAAKTSAIRWADFLSFQGKPQLSQYIKANSRMFRHVYDREVLDVTYDEAIKKIGLIKDEAIRKHALAVLQSGVRWSESKNIDDNGKVIGKGGKPRKVFSSSDNGPQELREYLGNYMRFYRALKAVGLKPHTLRKLAATQFANKGLSAHELTYVMGWSCIQTAFYYLQPKADADILKKIR